MPYFDYSGGRLYYQLDGDRSLPNLILSNSLGTNLSMWDPQMPTLRENFSVLRYDGRGQGRSSVPAGPYSINQLGADVLALSGHLDMKRFSFCGLSMGGLIGQWLGVHASNRIYKLVLCNTAAKIGVELSWDQRIDSVRANGMGPIVPTAMERWFASQFHEHHPASVAPAREMLLTADPEGYIANCAAIRDADLRADIAGIRAQTLIVVGQQDPVTTSDDARFMAAHIPNATTLSLDAAHLSNIESAPAFTTGVLEFLLKGDIHG
jgi:3-oxoadipate enol-lactonase